MRTAAPTKISEAIILIAILAVTLSSAACTPNRRIVESSRTPEPAPRTESSTPQASGFESDLQSMRTADFKFILVFRRKDGAPMDAEDKRFINDNTPPDVNRRRLSDSDKAVIIGSNFPFIRGTIENLTGRFVMEDHSKPDAGPLEVDRSANANTAANANGRRGRTAVNGAENVANE